MKIAFTETNDGVILPVRLQPKASRTTILGDHDGALKVAVTAPPVDGKANQALIAFLAKQFKMAKTAITIITGESSRDKRLLLRSCRIDDVRPKLKSGR